MKKILFVFFITLLSTVNVKADMPSGSYNKSCRECSIQNDSSKNVLQCKCCFSKKRACQEASLDVATCTYEIQNCDGVLTCGGCDTYQDSCSKCSITADGTKKILSCGCCKFDNPRPFSPKCKPSGLDVTNCHEGVANCNGYLKCGNCDS